MVAINSGLVRGAVRDGGAATYTSSSYSSFTVDTWYRACGIVNSSNDRIDFYIYNDAGAQLWTDYLTAIPTNALSFGAGFFSTSASAGALAYIDYMAFRLGNNLTR
jgi:hypothetical protein